MRCTRLTADSPRALRFAALHVPAYRRYFAVNLLSMTADNIEHVISYWVIFQLFRSPTARWVRGHQPLGALSPLFAACGRTR